MTAGAHLTASVARPPDERAIADVVIAGLGTKADRIRALAHAGYLRTEIATLLNIRYQHVRHVLERSGISLGRVRDAVPAALPTAASASFEPKPDQTTATEGFPPSRLIDAGFVRIGQWTSVSDEAFALDSVAPRDAGVYAFVVDGVISYVGLTQRGLRGRMSHYVRGHSRQRTSARVKGRILAALRFGSRIEILVATPDAMEWNGLPVLTAPGLEAGLIRLIQPEWNMQGRGQ